MSLLERMENLTVIAFLKDLVCLLCILFGFSGVISEEKSVIRFEDSPFLKENFILGSNVTCGNSTWGKYAGVTYTCDDIKVNGFRLAYGYYPGWGVDDLCQETGGKHEFAELCLKLLMQIDKGDNGIHAAIVNNASCSYIAETRYLLKKTGLNNFTWTTMSPGWGWASSLSCMIKS